MIVNVCFQLSIAIFITVTSHERYVVSNHRQSDCLFDSFFGITPTKASKPHITGTLWRKSIGDRWIPEKGDSNAEAVFMRWHHPVGMDPQISRGSLAYRSWRIQYWTKTFFMFTEPFVTGRPRICFVHYFRCTRSQNCCLNDSAVWLIQCSQNTRMIF